MLGLAAFVWVAASAVLWFRRMRAVSIPRDRTAFVLAWALGALAGVLAFVRGVGWPDGIAAGLALLGSGFLLFTVGVSRQRVGADAIRVGAALPDFAAPDENGERFEIASLAGRPLLLKFFRGHW